MTELVLEIQRESDLEDLGVAPDDIVFAFMQPELEPEATTSA